VGETVYVLDVVERATLDHFSTLRAAQRTAARTKKKHEIATPERKPAKAAKK